MRIYELLTKDDLERFKRRAEPMITGRNYHATETRNRSERLEVSQLRPYLQSHWQGIKGELERGKYRYRLII